MSDVRYKWVCSHCGSDSLTFSANKWDGKRWIAPKEPVL